MSPSFDLPSIEFMFPDQPRTDLYIQQHCDRGSHRASGMCRDYLIKFSLDFGGAHRHAFTPSISDHWQSSQYLCHNAYVHVCVFQIGWRKFSLRCYDLQQPKWMAVLNVLWPTLICLLIVASCVTQIIACFRRDSVSGPCSSFMP